MHESTSMARTSKAVAARSSGMTSFEPPRRAALLTAPRQSTGRRRRFSGKTSLFCACSWAEYIMRYSRSAPTVLCCTA